MELDELKYQLKDKLASDNGRSSDDLAALLGKRTVSITGKLKRSLWIEIIFSVMMMIGLACLGLYTIYQSIRIYFLVFAVASGILAVILYVLLTRLNRLSASTLPVKGNLQTIVSIFEEFIKRYFQFTMALVPICFAFAFVLAYSENKRIPAVDHLSKSHFNITWKVITFMTVYLAALWVAAYYFTKCYLRKLYGKHVVQLKNCVAELTE